MYSSSGGVSSPRNTHHKIPDPMSRFLPLLVMAVACIVNPLYAQDESMAPDLEFLGQVGDYPFSEAVRVGNMLYLSGEIGIDDTTMKLVEGGIQAETRQTLKNISTTLEKYGSDMDHVVKCTVMLADIAEWPAMNDIYKTFFPNHKPARSAFAGSGLAMNARTEIECMAVVK